jgi:hypothetical protein
MNATDREYEAGDRQCTEIAQLIGDLERQSQMEGGGRLPSVHAFRSSLQFWTMKIGGTDVLLLCYSDLYLSGLGTVRQWKSKCHAVFATTFP